MTAPSMSVVIPAHNEERVIGRTLETLLRGADSGELEVVVACNGCTDATARIAARYEGVQVVEVAQASKAAALNAGDRAATAFPRVFLDADIDVSTESLRAVGELLRVPAARAAAPRVRFDITTCSWVVRAYYAVWQRLPYISDGLVGTGFYALSEAGRARFDSFPALVADDLFVRRLFRPDECVTSVGSFLVRPPRDLGSLLRSKSRAYAGNVQLARAMAAGEVPTVAVSAGRDAGTVGTRAALLRLAASPSWWPRLAAYLGVVVAAKARAESRVRRGRTTTWEQDVSGRSA